jgi:hypothetical protein
MAASDPVRLPLKERARYAMYGMIAGLVVGVVLGWVFHKTVGFVLTILFITPFVILAVLAVMYWRRTSSAARSASRDSLVTDVDWRETDPSRPPSS